MRCFLGGLGKRFAQYVVADGEFATAPFPHTVGDLGLRVVARLKDSLPELMIRWLLVVLALTIERPHRLRYLRRGLQAPRTGAELVLILWVNLFSPLPCRHQLKK